MDPGFYPLKERVEEAMTLNENDVAIVDVGGGMGHDLVELKRKQPTFCGRFVLQDLPQVIEQITQPLEGIEATVHDFYTPQPVQGERRVPVYYLFIRTYLSSRRSCLFHAFSPA